MAERDWVAVVTGDTCEECGLRASAVPRDGLGAALGEEAASWVELLASASVSVLARHQMPGWSALEYAAHARDVLRVFADRIERALVEEQPSFGWWDHEAAVIHEGYNTQDPCEVGAVLAERANMMAMIIARLRPEQWTRTGIRGEDQLFTVEGLVRFALHEIRHHRYDAGVRVQAVAANG